MLQMIIKIDIICYLTHSSVAVTALLAVLMDGFNNTARGRYYSAREAVSKSIEDHIDMVSCVLKCQTRAVTCIGAHC